ncbi:hypothetical protein SVAN01_01387 [Stagonosporopsis vannaccii]|nr:hypothetical protein SVAN01_01387 [Stagonosporopsis vannaccii]
MPTHDRAFWQRFATSPVLLKISKIVRGLGLRQLNTGIGKIQFEHKNVDRLADAVNDATKRLPITLEGVVDAATEYSYATLQEEITQLRHRFGEEVWGANTCTQSLATSRFFANRVHRLMYYLRLWILVKAFNRTRNKNRRSRGWPSSPSGATGHDKRDSSGQLNEQPPKGTKRPRKYLSEEIIRDSSEEPEEEIAGPMDPPFDGTRSPDIQIDQTSSSAKEPRHKTEDDMGLGHELDEARLISAPTLSKKRKLSRQGPRACKSCQQRHQRCDRIHPVCGRCEQFEFICEAADVTEPSPTARRVLRFLSKYLTLGSTNTGQNSAGKLARNSTKPLTNSKTALASCWSKYDGHYFSLQGDERRTMITTMRSLGLRATSQNHSKFGFVIEHFASLGKDINKIARELSSKYSESQLAQCAEDPTYLDDEIDKLFQTYSFIWSLDADRAKLLAPSISGDYPK